MIGLQIKMIEAAASAGATLRLNGTASLFVDMRTNRWYSDRD